jgi:arylsulfatase A-like enzyme
MDSTLVVILGDHGEAFGQHGNMFHRLLYEEEVRIPFLLLNSKLFQGEIDSTLGGAIDIAPTVMDLLGYSLPGEWQGRSLFSRNRFPRVYLFGPYSGLFGEREGKWKLIYNPIAGSAELYDLATDPNEQHNLAFKYPELVESGRDRLAAWVQYQKRFYREHGVQ